MKKRYQIGSIILAALPLAAFVSCSDKNNLQNQVQNQKVIQIKTNQDKAHDDLKIISQQLNPIKVEELINNYHQEIKQFYEDLKKQYETNPIIVNKNINKIVGEIKSKLEWVKWENKKITFRIVTEFTKGGVEYTVIHEAYQAPIEVVEQDNKYILAIKVKTVHWDSRMKDIIDATEIRVKKHYVSIRDIFGSWDDNLESINKDQNDNIVRNISLFHTNDVHGRMKSDGGKYTKYIGMSGIASYVKKFKPDLLLSGGDFMQGTGVSNYDHGKSAMQIASLIGYDAIAAGNHEFDWGYKTLVGRAKSAPIYSTNTFYRESKTIQNYNPIQGPLANSYHISTIPEEHVLPGIRTKIVKGNLKVGIISLTTPDVATKVNPSNVNDIAVELLSKHTQKEINNLKAAGAELIVIVGHMGNEATSVETSKKLLEKIEGVHLVIDGHSHQLYEPGKTLKDKTGKDIPIGQTGEHSRNIGIMKFDFDKTKQEIINFSNKYINYDQFIKLKLPKVADVEAIIEKAQATYDLYAGQDAFVLKYPLSNRIIINGNPETSVLSFEASAGNFFADALLWEVLKSYPQDLTTSNNIFLNQDNTIGFTNGGAIRASVEGHYWSKMTTKKDWMAMSPFNNSLSVIRVTGKELWDMFAHSAKSWTDGPFAQVSKNVQVEYEVYKGRKDKDGNELKTQNRVKSLKINNIVVENNDSKTYYVAGNNFLRKGNDGYKDIWTKPEEVYSGGTLSDVLIAYGISLGKDQGDFRWSEYNVTEIKPSQGQRIKVIGKDQAARDFINRFDA